MWQTLKKNNQLNVAPILTQLQNNAQQEQYFQIFYHTQTLINIWIIFLTQYLPKKNIDPMAIVAPSIKGLKV